MHDIKERVTACRLIEKLDRNPEYAKQLSIRKILQAKKYVNKNERIKHM